MRTEGNVAVVTGGASGLGQATTETLAQAGASVVICDLPGPPGQQLAAQLGAEPQRRTALSRVHGTGSAQPLAGLSVHLEPQVPDLA